jgi:soluble P-type ATPase
MSGHGSGEAHVLVAVDGHLAGVIVMAGELRTEAAAVVARLWAEGIAHIAMVSGDRRSVANRVGAELGLDRVYADQSPAGKVDVIRRLRQNPRRRPVVMVGDGVNDAPALAVADAGIAMGAGGATISSETADAVITVDRIDRVADAVHAGRRSLAIARQSVIAGMGVSVAAMGVAATGHLPPARRCAAPRGHRPRRDPQRAPRAARLTGSSIHPPDRKEHRYGNARRGRRTLLSQRRIAVAGVFRDPKHPANLIDGRLHGPDRPSPTRE